MEQFGGGLWCVIFRPAETGIYMLTMRQRAKLFFTFVGKNKFLMMHTRQQAPIYCTFNSNNEQQC